MGHQLSHMCEMKEKNFLFLRDDHEHEWPSFIYKRKPNVWWVTNYHICVRWKKKFFVSPWPWTWVTIYYIYKMRPNVWWVTNYHICVRWKKKFFDVRGRTMNHEWPSFIYIRGNLTCDGSPTIMDVWDGRKNFLMFMEGPWPWVTIYYIYKRKPNVWWVTNYHRCVRWKKKFFWFFMTNTNVCCVSLVCVSWHKNIFCKESPPVMVMWRFWFAR